MAQSLRRHSAVDPCSSTPTRGGRWLRLLGERTTSTGREDGRGLARSRRDSAQPGDVLSGRYALKSVLGRGGCATVFRAGDRESGRDVALKLLRADLVADPDVVRWFQREARILRLLDHRHIVNVLDAANDEGSMYLVMELLEGATLARVLERHGALDPSKALELLRPVVEAIAFAHSHGVVHRDLKPSNIFVEHADGNAEQSRAVKVLDFGLAKVRELAARSATLTGVVIGTPGYMPPEQILGESSIGPEADVWSLGTVLYEALSGRLPFEGGSRSERLLRVLTSDPVPLRQRLPTIPSNLAQVVTRALSNDPAARQPDARALLAALDECGAHATRSGTHRRPMPADRIVLGTCAFERCGRTLVLVHSASAPTDAEWDQWLDRMSYSDWDRLLVWSRGGAPTARQRAATAEFWRGRTPHPMAVVTASRIVRGAVTAFSWLLGNRAAAFDPSRYVDAMDFLGIPTAEQERCLAVSQRLRAMVTGGAEDSTARRSRDSC